MEGNKITEWSYDKPTEPGMYLCCYGDVKVADNISLVHFDEDMVELGEYKSTHVSEWGSGFEWARLLVGSEAKA